MHGLLIAIGCTLAVSFFCSLLEALVLSTTVAEAESLRKKHQRRGQLFETMRGSLDETISAILTLNTIANTLGAVIIGGLAAQLFGEALLGAISAALAFTILVFAEVLPKNIGLAYRRRLLPYAVYPLWWLRRVFLPITYLCNLVVRFFIREKPGAQPSDEQIILLAERGAQEGTLTTSESRIIANALSLDDVRVGEIMTPRTVVTALKKNATVGEVFREYPNLPFGRMPVYQKNLDDIVGLARRRDLLKAKANDQDQESVGSLMQEVHFIPETVTAGNALQVFLKTHQQLLVVVDEFGSTAGVLTMEDVMEHILGREIFEKDDVAVDMRELARTRQHKTTRPGPPRPAGGNPPSPKNTAP